MSSKFSLFNLHSHRGAESSGSPSTQFTTADHTDTTSGDNIFKAFSNDPPPIATRPDHPVPRTVIRSRSRPVSDTQLSSLSPIGSTPLETNKFYSNLFLGSQSCPAWSQPYSIWWSKGRGNCQSWGMSITHIERDSLAYGPMNAYNACNYFFGPIGIQHMCLSATELGSSTQLYMDSLSAFSANVNLSPSPDAAPILSMPLVQGMGMPTAIYRGCTPLVQTSIFLRNFSSCGTINSGATEKYKVTLEDGFQWVIYRTADHSMTPNVRPMSQISNSTIKGDPGFHGFIQIAKLPPGINDTAYDVSAGAYATFGSITAVRDGSTIKYAFNWTKAGLPKPLLMFALPHHVQSFDSMMSQYVSNIQLWTNTKGKATAVFSDRWVLVEHIYTGLGFAPYDLQRGSINTISPSAKSLIAQIGTSEVQQDVRSQSVLDSMYFSGKGLGKFAMMIYVLHDMVNRSDLAATGLSKLKDAIAIFINNNQPNPLVYEQSWKGVVSTAGMGGDPGVDFGNSFYNDHHFHYGYFVYAASVIGYLDPSWLSNQRNRNWINMLVRDFGNPGQDDYFPFSRSFDWYNGHSWAKGLFESGDGKDQESSSEDSFASYAVKMWGKVSGNRNLEATGDLRIALQKRSFNNYFLMQADNTCQPPQFIGNKVTGILFENKIDHATYFGGNIEYIQGIHMIPCSPVSSIIRNPQFASEEWSTYFSNGRNNNIAGGWRGIVNASQAQFDPRAAYAFFTHPNFDPGWLDGGASRTWYLAYCAALANA